MSIIVKGMEMPDCCTRCDYLGLNVAIGCPVMTGVNGRATDCPLVEVPPHGRLIDADALMLMIQEYIDEYGWDVDERGFHSEKWCAMKETEMAINDAPTVIPADKDGET